MQLLMVCLLVEVTMSALVYASALQQCMQSSKYGSHYGIALLGYSYKSFVANLLVTCYRTCQQEPSCQSLNYNLANRICEFNSFAKRPDDLEDKLDNFVYAVNPNRKVEGRSGRTPPPPPWTDAGPSQDYFPPLCRWYPFILLGEERQSGIKAPCLRKQRDGRCLSPRLPDREFKVLTATPLTHPWTYPTAASLINVQNSLIQYSFYELIMDQLVLLKEISMLGEKGEYYNPESQESELSGV